MMKRRKAEYLAHDIIEIIYYKILIGKIEGRMGIGRRKPLWYRNIREWMNILRISNIFNLAFACCKRIQ